MKKRELLNAENYFYDFFLFSDPGRNRHGSRTTQSMHSSKNDDRRDLNRLENERAEKIQEDPAYDEVEDENDLSKDIEIKDRL